MKGTGMDCPLWPFCWLTDLSSSLIFLLAISLWTRTTRVTTLTGSILLTFVSFSIVWLFWCGDTPVCLVSFGVEGPHGPEWYVWSSSSQVFSRATLFRCAFEPGFCAVQSHPIPPEACLLWLCFELPVSMIRSVGTNRGHSCWWGSAQSNTEVGNLRHGGPHVASWTT